MTDTSNITINHLPYKKVRKYSMINSIDNKKIYLDEISLDRQDNFNINSLELWNRKSYKYSDGDDDVDDDTDGTNDNYSYCNGNKTKKKMIMMMRL